MKQESKEKKNVKHWLDHLTRCQAVLGGAVVARVWQHNASNAGATPYTSLPPE
jgi:hypothetical protein